MAKWVRFTTKDGTGFGTLDGETITVHAGSLHDNPTPTGQTLALADVRLEAPCAPSKIIALWNNFHALAAKLNVAEPAEPLYLLKAVTSVAPPDAEVRRPVTYDGKTVYEGELGIVIGKTATNISEAEAADHILGYTIVNDLTAADILNRDPTFPQWARAKGLDGYGPFGPWIVTDFDAATASVRTVLNGAERQNYALADMIFPPAKLVSLLSKDMTLNPGDLIACGTSIGVGSMKEPRNEVDVIIDGIGTLRTIFVQ